ncbi:uncharacterized protein VICG_01357 [Vittaforma corneae ATCC 50505]|uniref:Mediator of RNA polymerase II transcription subunit 18 n=1 Tax=Vittaforma corneae (strain ATCC 50505) TaxID=993615 RepID=L2GLW8_VITCO|nr:uncharacterized protein VICG_01357 [Vittaforma corneae ATCC 50505]ELA41609.1 hypothetical protein VICG_01357 [Vittaforma corneae ATCC 50505]
MLECALFGMCREKLGLSGKQFSRIEKVYETGGKKAIAHIEKGRDEMEIHFYDTPDRNKQRMSIVRKKTVVPFTKDYDKFLTAIGYKNLCVNLVEGFRYYRNGYTIEITKMKRTKDILDSSEENELVSSPDLPECLFEYYLVKVFTNTESVNVGEEILNTAFHELNDVVKLVKPAPSIF